MKENPFEHTEPFRVGKPVYSPGEVLHLIKEKAGFITSDDLREYFKDQQLVARVALADFEVSGLIDPTDEFRQNSGSERFCRVYKLTPLGEFINPSLLRPRIDIKSFKFPPDVLALLNKMANGTITKEEMGILAKKKEE